MSGGTTPAHGTSSGSSTILGTPKPIFWAAIGILTVCTIFVLWYFYGDQNQSSDDTDLKPRTSNESDYTEPKEAFRLKPGVTYSVTLKPGEWISIRNTDPNYKLQTDGLGSTYLIKSSCQPEIDEVGGGKIEVVRKQCELIQLSAIDKETYVEYEIVPF